VSGNRIFSLFAWLLIGVAGLSVLMSVSAMVMMSTPEPSVLGFAAVAAGGYGWRLLSNRQSALVS
jgi:uncharacterized membrane protein